MKMLKWETSLFSEKQNVRFNFFVIRYCRANFFYEYFERKRARSKEKFLKEGEEKKKDG